MEICRGLTHAIVKFGLDELLPKEIELVHRPGCPVCVTPLQLIDKAVQIAQRPDVVFCSFGDMLRMPGSEVDLFGILGIYDGGDHLGLELLLLYIFFSISCGGLT